MSNNRFDELIEEMKALRLKKNAGYAGQGNPDPWANFRMSSMFNVSPFVGCLVRISDKFIRVSNLIKNPRNEQVGESIKDTLFDMANYCLIAICLLEQEKEPANTVVLPQDTQAYGIWIKASDAK